MKRFFLFLLLIVGCFFAPHCLKRLTFGFHPAKFCPPLPLNDLATLPLPKEKEEEILAILKQPFSYFNLGAQSYVFQSGDGKYVLKLFRYNLSQFPFIHHIKQRFHRSRGTLAKESLLPKMEKTFQAYTMAYQEVPECTEIVYAHLNPKRGRFPPVTLSDPMGRTWTLPIGSYRFVIQKKADPLKATLLKAYASNNRAEMEQLLDSFVELLDKRTDKQISNSDHTLGANFGFFNGRAIEGDCGNYRKSPELSDPQKKIQEMDRFIFPFFCWIKEHTPEFASYFHHRYFTVYEQLRGQEKSPSSPLSEEAE